MTDDGTRLLRAVIVAFLVVVVAFGVFASTQLRDARADEATATTRAVNAADAALFTSRVDGLVGDALDLAGVVAVQGPDALPPTAPGLSLLTFVPADPPRALIAALLAQDVDVVALRPWFDRARDGANPPVLSAPVGSPPTSAFIVPLYRSAGGSLSRTPSSVATAIRRDEIEGFVVAVVDVDAVTAGADDGAWVLTDGPVALRSTGGVGGDTVSAEIDIADRQWTLTRAVAAPTGGRGLVLLATFLVAIVLAAIALHRVAVRALARRAQQARDANDRAETIATLSGVTRQSNELADVLPGLAVQLGDALGLDGMALAAPRADGSLHDVFAHGVRPDDEHPVRLSDAAAVAAGQTVSVPLHRAGRSIATLRVVAGRDLTAAETELLEIAAEMVTAAIVTARSIEQQQDAVARLQAVDELKTAFLGTASHELRTPVTAISGFAHVLVDRWDELGEPERRVFAERIASNARALDALVQDLLDFARLERGDNAIAIETLDLASTVAGVLDRLAPVWQERDIEPHLETGVIVRADRASLERITTNLVSNAVKFSPDGSAVVVTVRVEGDRALLVVDDAGPGVPDGERDKIFARFFRGTSQAVVRTRGVGIGLSVVKDFVERMHGSVSVAQSPAGGARFVVELPTSDASAADVPSHPEEEHDVPAP